MSRRELHDPRNEEFRYLYRALRRLRGAGWAVVGAYNGAEVLETSSARKAIDHVAETEQGAIRLKNEEGDRLQLSIIFQGGGGDPEEVIYDFAVKASLMPQIDELLAEPFDNPGHAIDSPLVGDLEVEVWAERDRQYVGVRNKRTGDLVAEWWDEGVSEMIDDGFFYEPHGVAKLRIPAEAKKFEESVKRYLVDVGLAR